MGKLMSAKISANEILDIIDELFPNAKCELNYDTPFQLLVAVVLSAQCSDAVVNSVTPKLFEVYGSCEAMSNASLSSIEQLIHSIGLYHNKAISLKELSISLVNDFGGEVPSSMKDLTSLRGVGRKSANVVRSEYFKIPSIPVDTHVERVSKALGLVKPNDSVLVIERKLKLKLRRDRWISSHHQLIFFGRYFCTARRPKCEICPFLSFCKKTKERTR